MVPVRAQDAVGFAVDPAIDRFAVANACKSAGRFGLKVETEFVRRRERGFGRAPGVEPDVVQTVRLADADDALPRIDVGGGVACLREDGALECSAQEYLVPVQDELRALCRDVPEAEDDGAGITEGGFFLSPAQLDVHSVERGGELVPELRVVAHRVGELRATVAGLPAHGDFQGRRTVFPLCVGARRRYAQRAASATLRGVADCDDHARRARFDVRVDLHVVDPHEIRGAQANAAYDAVPVALRMIGDTVRAFTHVDDHPVVHAYGQYVLLVPSCRERVRQVVLVWGGEAVL